MVYLTTLSVAQAIQRRIPGYFVVIKAGTNGEGGGFGLI
jgi:hypothetical protein